MPGIDGKKRNRKGFTLVELIVTIAILGILMAVAIPSLAGYYRKMDMIKANDSARQIYAAAQNRLTAMKANGQLEGAGLTADFGLVRVPAGSAARGAETSRIEYYYMNTEKAVEFLNQGGQSLDDELVDPRASILIELDPENGSVFGVFFAAYSDGDSTPFSYDGDGKRGLQGAMEGFCGSEEERSQGRARIGYYGGAAAKLEYESSLKTPMMEVINEEELIVKLTSYGQPADFSGYLIRLEGEDGTAYEHRVTQDQLAMDASGAVLAGNSYNLLLDSLTEEYSFDEILGRDFIKKGTQSLDPGENITVTVMAVGGTADSGAGGTTGGTADSSVGGAAGAMNQSFENREEVSSLFAGKTEEAGRLVITVSNGRHLQNLNAMGQNTGLNEKGNVVRQVQDIDWNATLSYYNGLTAEGIPAKDKASNASSDRALPGGNDQAAFTPVESGEYNFTAAREWGSTIKDTSDTGYKIKNIRISGGENAGLFGEFSGSMNDVTLINPRVGGTRNVGALVGVYTAQDSNAIKNCKVYLDPDEDPSQAVFPYEDYSVSGGWESCGGLAGVVKKGEVTGSFAAINVKGKGGAAGGLAGDVRNARLEGCYASGQVSGSVDTALGGFVGACTENTEILRCYATGDLTSVGAYAGSFLGQYKSAEGNTDGIDIRDSYAVGSQRAREEGVAALPFAGSTGGEVGADCYYLGKETSCGAVGLDFAQMTGTAVVKGGKTLDQIYQEGFRYPSQYGTGAQISERIRLTHPYDINGQLTELDTVYPYPALTLSIEGLPVPMAHYGDWALEWKSEGDNLQLFYYEKYGDSDYGYYFKDRSASAGLDPAKTILETGYGLMVPEENAAAPSMGNINGYYNADTHLGLGKLEFTPIEDFYQVIGGVHYYGLKINGSSMSGTDAGEQSWQKTMAKSYRTQTPYNYISFTYGGKVFRFNPCFAKAMEGMQKDEAVPAWFGSQKNAFVVRTEAQLKCIDGFGEYTSGGSHYYFSQERERILLAAKAWIPLCPNGFMGSYEGNGYTVGGLVIQASSWVTTKTNLGLFDTVGSDGGSSAATGSAIRSLTVETADEGYQKAIRTERPPDQGDVYFGILAGKCKRSSWIENCNTVLNASIQFSNGNAHSIFTEEYYRTYIGGLVGYSNGTVRGCQVWGDGEIQALQNQEVCAGGFAGYLDKNASVQTGSTGIQCLTNTNVRVSGFAAGFAAENKGSISNAYSGGMVEGKQLYNAGFVVANHPYASIENCSAGISAEEPIQVRQSGNTGEGGSSAGFAAVNGGTIENSNVYAKVETTSAYAAGFVLENCGKTSQCDAVVSVYNPQNTAVGFVRKNAWEICTIPGGKNSRAETFNGKEVISGCNVCSIYKDRETVNLYGAQSAAGFVGINENEIASCSVKSSIEVYNSGQHISGAGFITTNKGKIGNCYSNSILTVKEAGGSHDASAAGFAYENRSFIDMSYADCITTAQSDHNAKAAGFVLLTGASGDELPDTISNCYALLEVRAEGYTPGAAPAKSQVSGFVLSNNKNVNISSCYSASALDGDEKFGFAPAGIHVEDCFYLSFGGNVGASGAGMPLTESELHTLDMGSLWEEASVETTHPNSPSLSQMAYPYPKILGLDHYGDWFEVVENDGSIFYYEKYSDGDYGIYLMVNNYRAYSTLSDTGEILDWGYGVLVGGDLKKKGDMTVYSRDYSGKSIKVKKDSLAKWVDGTEIAADQPFGDGFRLYPFKADKLEVLQKSVKDSSVQYLYTKMDATDTYNFFHPCFAAAVNSKSYASVAGSNMPDASFGMEGEPFKIRHVDHFYYMVNRGYESKGSHYRYFEQERDIDLQDRADTGTWNPWDIRYKKGNQGNGQYLKENPYIGDYNGNGFTIHGYRLPASTNAQYVGLFGYLGDGDGNGAIRNVVLEVSKASVSLGKCEAAGLLAAYVAAGSSIVDCSVDIGGGTVSFSNTVAMAGGIVGGSAGRIYGTGLYGDGKIRVSRGGAAQVKAGGFAAENRGDISGCEVKGVSVEADANFCYAAGFTAYNYGSITGSGIYSARVISLQRTAAGFVMENSGTVTLCTAEDTHVEGKWSAAGFVYNNGHDNANTEFDGLTNSSPVMNDDYGSVRIGGCSFQGTVVSSQTEACGFARYNFGTIADSSVSGEVTFGTGNDGTAAFSDKGASGFCQTNLGTISGGCKTDAKVMGQSFNASGAGFTVNNYGTIRGNAGARIEASGSVASKKAAAGFVVFNTGTIDYAAYTGTSVDSAYYGKTAQAAGFAVENGNGKTSSAQILHSMAGGKGTLSVRGDSDSAGFVVQNSGSVEGCTASGLELVNNSQEDHNAAGFVCVNSASGTIQKSGVGGRVDKAVSGEKGTAGFAASNAGEISNQCTASVSVDTDKNASGFVGVNEAGGIIRGTSLISVRVLGENVVIRAAKGSSAGFAAQNRGTIEYASVELGDQSVQGLQGEGAGFVLKNEKSIRTSDVVAAVVSGSESVSGFAAQNGSGALIQNVSVERQTELRAGTVYGFVRENEGTITGGNVFPGLSAADVYGFAGTNRSEALITKSMVQVPAISGTGLAVGFAGKNLGEITDSAVELHGETEGGIVNLAASKAEPAGKNQGDAAGSAASKEEPTGENQGDAAGSAASKEEPTGENQGDAAGSAASKEEPTGKNQGDAAGSAASKEEPTGKNQGNVAGSVYAEAEPSGEIKGRDAYGFLETNERGGRVTDVIVLGEAVRASQKAAGFAGLNLGVIEAKNTGCNAKVRVFSANGSAAGFLCTNGESGKISGNAPDQEKEAVFVAFMGESAEAEDELGSVCGFVGDNQGTISYAGAEVQEGIKAGGSAAGFAGKNSKEISFSYVKGDTESRNSDAAGFAAENSGRIGESFADGKLFAGTGQGASEAGTGQGASEAGTGQGASEAGTGQGASGAGTGQGASEAGTGKGASEAGTGQGASEAGTGQGASAAGFVLASSGEISDSFSVCDIQSGAGGDGLTAGFVKDASGSIEDSYSISRQSAGTGYSFEAAGTGARIENCHYLDWEGTNQAAPSKAAQPKTEEELRKLADDDGVLSPEIWQANYIYQEQQYTYPSIIGLPLPKEDLKGGGAWGMFYYEKSGGQYQFYKVSCDGYVQDGLQADSVPDETGYGVYQRTGMADQAVLTQFGGKVSVGELPEIGGSYSYWKLTDPASVYQIIPLELKVGDETSYFYIDTKFAAAIERVWQDDSGKMPGCSLGSAEGNPLGVRTPQQLMEIKSEDSFMEYLAKSYVQRGDIDLGGVSFAPIGGSDGSNSFRGRYDGGGYRITGLAVTEDCAGQTKYLGLFGRNSGELLDIHVEGTISTTGEPAAGYVGGLTGANLEGGRISLCSCDVDVKNAGFSGWGSSWVGGFTGSSKGVIEKSYASGDVENGNYIGGFAGILEKASAGEESGVSDSYCTGNVVKSGGGSPGQFAGNISRADIVRCYAYNTAYNKTTAVFKMAGNGTYNALSCYYLGKESAGTASQKQLSAEDMRLRDSYAGFDFGGVWMMNGDDNGYVTGYPCPQLFENPQRYGAVVYQWVSELKTKALEDKPLTGSEGETEADDGDGKTAGKDKKTIETETKGTETGIKGTEKETKGAETETKGTEKETKGTETGIKGTEKETKGTETGTKGTEKETKGAETGIKGTEKETKGAETETKGTEKETKGTETGIKGTEKETKGTEGESQGTEKGIKCTEKESEGMEQESRTTNAAPVMYWLGGAGAAPRPLAVTALNSVKPFTGKMRQTEAGMGNTGQGRTGGENHE